MSGILNNKQRFVDTVITQEGRRQLASGEFKVEFATFSDVDAFYGKHPDSGSIDMSNQFQLEAPSFGPVDTVTLESNLFGNVVASTIPGVMITSGSRESMSGSFEIINGQIEFHNASGSKHLIRGDDYAGMIDSILSASIGNFAKLQTIGTFEPLMDDTEFKLSTSEARFEITNDNVDLLTSLPEADLDEAESIFADRHLAHLPNFKYLPPRNRATSQNPTGSLLFDYPDNRQAEMMTLEDVERNVAFLPNQVVDFSNTSRANNVVCQMFETSGDRLTKLSIIDFGEFLTNNPDRPTKRFYFVGKVFPTDKFGTKTYVNMFTLEFD